MTPIPIILSIQSYLFSQTSSSLSPFHTFSHRKNSKILYKAPPVLAKFTWASIKLTLFAPLSSGNLICSGSSSHPHTGQISKLNNSLKTL